MYNYFILKIFKIMVIINAKKLIGFVLIFMFLNTPLFAQKINIRNIKISYNQLPLLPLDENIKTYSAELSMDVTLKNTDIDKINNQYLKLSGFKRVKEQNDVLIKVTFGKFEYNKGLIKEDVYNINMGKNMPGYYYKVDCIYPVNLSLLNEDGNAIFSQAIIYNERLMKFDYGKWTYSISELDNKLNAEKQELFTDLKNKCDKKALSEIKNILASNFSNIKVSKKIKVASGKGKKVDYSDLESAIRHMEKAFELISSESDSENANTELNKAVKIWENALKESSKSKKARINETVSTMLYYNIAIAYWWMLDFTKAIEYAKKALKFNSSCKKPSSSNEKLIKESIEDMNDYEKRLKVHGKL